MAYFVPEGAYPTSPFEKFVTGGFEGWEDASKLADKAADLKIKMLQYEAGQEFLRNKTALKPAEGVTGETGLPGPDTTGSGGAGGAGGAGVSGGGAGAINPDQAHAYLANNLAASPQETALLMGSIAGESGFRPDILHDGGKGYGLFGHNSSRLAAMRQFAGVGPNAPVPWQKQLAFGLQELRNRPEGQLVNQANTAEDITKLGFRFEQPAGWQNPTAHQSWSARLAATGKYFGGAAPSTTEKVPEAGIEFAQVPASGELPSALTPPAAGPALAASGGFGTGLLGAPAQPTLAATPAAPVTPAVATAAPGRQAALGSPNLGLSSASPTVWSRDPRTPAQIAQTNRAALGRTGLGGPSRIPMPAGVGPAVPYGLPYEQPTAAAPPLSPVTQLMPAQQQFALVPVNSGLWG